MPNMMPFSHHLFDCVPAAGCVCAAYAPTPQLIQLMLPQLLQLPVYFCSRLPFRAPCLPRLLKSDNNLIRYAENKKHWISVTTITFFSHTNKTKEKGNADADK
jgi:hypothetical protein